MNRFLLLALTAGLLSPIAAKAETWYLLVKGKSAPISVPTESREECEESGKKAIDKNAWTSLQKGRNDQLFLTCNCINSSIKFCSIKEYVDT